MVMRNETKGKHPGCHLKQAIFVHLSDGAPLTEKTDPYAPIERKAGGVWRGRKSHPQNCSPRSGSVLAFTVLPQNTGKIYEKYE
jgi:hypothetical protein